MNTTPSPPPLSSSSADSSNASLATMNRVSIQSLCHPDGGTGGGSAAAGLGAQAAAPPALHSTRSSISTNPQSRRGSLHDILNEEPARRYSQTDLFAAEMLGNLKVGVKSPPPRHQNPFEVPIQIQPGYQPLKGLYSDTFPPNAPNANLNVNLHKTHERDTGNFPSDKGSHTSREAHLVHGQRTHAAKHFTRDSPYHSRTPSLDDDIRHTSFINRVYQSSKSYSPRFRYGAELVERWTQKEHDASTIYTDDTNTMPKAMSAKSLDAASIHMASNSAPPLIQKSSLHDFERLKSGIDDIQNSDTNGTQYSVDVGSQGLRMRIQTQPYAASNRGSPVPQSPSINTPAQASGSNSAQVSGPTSRATSSPTDRGTPAPGAPRSAWQEVLISATSLASLSQDSRKRLRYCLHLLKLANAHLASTVTKLQGAIAEETAYSLAQSIAANHVPHNERQAYLHQPASNEPALSITALKADVVSTIRKIVKVVSQYAGNSLPEPARSHIRTYILGLPSRWASSSASANITPARSPAPSQSPTGSPKECVTPDHQGPPLPTNTATSPVPEGPSDEQLSRHRIEVEAGGKVLILANEALDMLGNIISIVDGTLERAEGWCEGINRVKQRFGGGVAEQQMAEAKAAAEAEAAQQAAGDHASASTEAVVPAQVEVTDGSQEDVEMGDA